MTEINHNKRLSDVLSHGKCPRCDSSDKEALVETITISDANIVGTNGLKAGVQV